MGLSTLWLFVAGIVANPLKGGNRQLRWKLCGSMGGGPFGDPGRFRRDAVFAGWAGIKKCPSREKYLDKSRLSVYLFYKSILRVYLKANLMVNISVNIQYYVII